MRDHDKSGTTIQTPLAGALYWCAYCLIAAVFSWPPFSVPFNNILESFLTGRKPCEPLVELSWGPRSADKQTASRGCQEAALQKCIFIVLQNYENHLNCLRSIISISEQYSSVLKEKADSFTRLFVLLREGFFF